MPYRPSTVTRDPEATRARAIEETSPSWYNLEVLSSDRPRATSSRLRTSWLKLASGSRDGHRRHAGLNGEGRTRAPSLCGIVVSYRRLGPELYGLPGAYMRQAVVVNIHKSRLPEANFSQLVRSLDDVARGRSLSALSD